MLRQLARVSALSRSCNGRHAAPQGLLIGSEAAVVAAVDSVVPATFARGFFTRLFRSAQEACAPGVSVSRASIIKSKLLAAMTPAVLDVKDVSGGCGEFFNVTIVSDRFEGMGTLARHRAVNGLIKDEIKSLHGIVVVALTPAQFKAQEAPAPAAAAEPQAPASASSALAV